MHTLNDDEKKYDKSLDDVQTTPIGIKATGGLPPLPKSTSTEARARVVISGRGQTGDRVPTLVRLRPDVVAELRTMVTGPIYLAIELAIRHYTSDLRNRPESEMDFIKAEDLG